MLDIKIASLVEVYKIIGLDLARFEFGYGRVCMVARIACSGEGF